MPSSRLGGWVERRAAAARGTDDPDRRRRARLVMWFAVVLEVPCVLFAVLHFAVHHQVVGWMLVGLGLTLTTVPWVLHRTSVALGAHWLLAQLFLLIDGAAWYSGAIHAPSVPWAAIVPVMATVAAGRRAGWVWLIVVAVNALLFAAASLAGVAPASGLAPEVTHAFLGAGVAMLALVALVFATIHEASQAVLHAGLHAAVRDMRQVLDHVGQGFFTAGADGRPGPHRSAVLTSWFGPEPDGQPFWAWMAPGDRRRQLTFALAWEALFDDVLPLAVTLEQLPRELRLAGGAFDLTYTPVLGPGGRPRGVVVVVEDARARVEADAGERVRREQAALLARVLRDRRGFVILRDEVQATFARLAGGGDAPLRDLHTWKGVASLWGLTTVAARCHALESALVVDDRPPSAAELDGLRASWGAATELAASVVDGASDRIEIGADDLRALEDAVARGDGPASLLARLAGWRQEPTAVTFARLAEQTRALAARLGKGPLEVTIHDHGLRLDPVTWAPVWSALVHALRNALDHGLEPASEREQRGKPAVPELRLVSRCEAGAVVIEVIDDGRGIDWERVRERARAAGLPHATGADLEDAVLGEGFSTRDEATELSGRGVGLAALVTAARAVGGALSIESTPGRGTCVRLTALSPDAAPHDVLAARLAPHASA